MRDALQLRVEVVFFTFTATQILLCKTSHLFKRLGSLIVLPKTFSRHNYQWCLLGVQVLLTFGQVLVFGA